MLDFLMTMTACIFFVCTSVFLLVLLFALIRGVIQITKEDREDD